MKLIPGSQITVLLWREPQQFTVTSVDQDVSVHASSNIQPFSVILWPTDYRPGVTFHKLGQPNAKGW